MPCAGPATKSTALSRSASKARDAGKICSIVASSPSLAKKPSSSAAIAGKCELEIRSGMAILTGRSPFGNGSSPDEVHGAPAVGVRAIWKIDPDRTLFRLDLGCPSHFPQFLSLVGNKLSKIHRRARNRNSSEVQDPPFHLGIGKGCVYLPVQLFDDLGGRAAWHAHAVPLARLVAWHEIPHRRDVGQCF